MDDEMKHLEITEHRYMLHEVRCEVSFSINVTPAMLLETILELKQILTGEQFKILVIEQEYEDADPKVSWTRPATLEEKARWEARDNAEFEKEKNRERALYDRLKKKFEGQP